MASKKIIVVIGATGNQGGSVARTFLGLPDWHVRAVTRDLSSEHASVLRTAGAEVVRADLNDSSSLVTAFSGAHAIFLNTDFWGVYRPLKAKLEAEGKDVAAASKIAWEQETAKGKAAIDVAASAAVLPTLERFVYSALHPIAKASGGKYTRSMHSEAKAWLVDYIESEQPELAKKTSFVYPGGYITHQMLSPTKRDPDSGTYQFVLPALKPETRMPIVDQKLSLGKFVRELVETEGPGTKLLAYNSYLTMQEIVDAWAAASGKLAGLVTVPVETMHEKFNVPWELLDAPSHLSEFDYGAGIDGLIEPDQLKNKVDTKALEAWLAEGNWGFGSAA